MSNQPVDQSRRTWVTMACAAGGVGGVATAIPFVSTFQPSERAKAAGAAVEADISALKPGEMMTVEWRGKPVWILKRTPEQVADKMEETWRETGCYGYNLTPSIMPSSVEDFVDQVVPILQKRGIYRTEYEGTTFRANLGLDD